MIIVGGDRAAVRRLGLQAGHDHGRRPRDGRRRGRARPVDHPPALAAPAHGRRAMTRPRPPERSGPRERRELGRRRRAPTGFPWAAPTWPVDLERDAPEPAPRVPTTTPSGPGATRPAWCGPCSSTTSPGPWPTSWPRPRYAATRCSSWSRRRSSSWPTTPATSTPACCCRCCPAAVRHKTVVAAAADHFFDRRWKAHLWALVLAAIPIERHRVNRKSAEDTAALVARGMEPHHLPRGWSDPRRLVPAHARRRRLPGHPHGPARGARAHRRHVPDLAPRAAGGCAAARPGSPSGPRIVAADGEDARRLEARIDAVLGALADESRTDWWTARRRAGAGRDSFAPRARGVAVAAGLGPRARPPSTRRGRRPPLGARRPTELVAPRGASVRAGVRSGGPARGLASAAGRRQGPPPPAATPGALGLETLRPEGPLLDVVERCGHRSRGPRQERGRRGWGCGPARGRARRCRGRDPTRAPSVPSPLPLPTPAAPAPADAPRRRRGSPPQWFSNPVSVSSDDGVGHPSPARGRDGLGHELAHGAAPESLDGDHVEQAHARDAAARRHRGRLVRSSGSRRTRRTPRHRRPRRAASTPSRKRSADWTWGPSSPPPRQ